MNSNPPTTLYYVHDPMCSWCWGFRPVWLEIKQRLPKHIRVISWVGGLAMDSDQPMPQSMRDKLQDTWRHIMQAIPGTEFNFDFWTATTPRRSTYPACRAVIAARRMAGKDEEMTLAIQRAYYLEAKNPSDLATLQQAAEDIGLNSAIFLDQMQSHDLQEAFDGELMRVRAIGVNSFPSLVLENADSRFEIHINYTSADAVLHEIQDILDSWQGQ